MRKKRKTEQHCRSVNETKGSPPESIAWRPLLKKLNKMGDVTKNFSLAELTKSDTAAKYKVSNEPSFDDVQNLRKLAIEVLQPIRDEYGKPIIVTSGYRSKAVNDTLRRLGKQASTTSQHMKGAAADLVPADGNVKALFACVEKMIKTGKLKVGQLIDEYGRWVHVSLPYTKTNQILHFK